MSRDRWSRRRSLVEQALDLPQQSRQLDRLGIEVVAARRERFLTVTAHRIGGEGDDGYVPSVLRSLELARRRPAIQHRQAQIHQNPIRPLARGKLHATGPLARDHYRMPLALEAALQDIDVVLIILYVQNLHARISLTFACLPRSIERGSMRPSSRSSSLSSEALLRITCSTYPFSRF